MGGGGRTRPPGPGEEEEEDGGDGVAEEVVEGGLEESDGAESRSGEMTGRQTVGVGEEEGEEGEAGPGGEEISVWEELTTGTGTRKELNTLSEK